MKKRKDEFIADPSCLKTLKIKKIVKEDKIIFLYNRTWNVIISVFFLISGLSLVLVGLLNSVSGGVKVISLALGGNSLIISFVVFLQKTFIEITPGSVTIVQRILPTIEKKQITPLKAVNSIVITRKKLPSGKIGSIIILIKLEKPYLDLVLPPFDSIVNKKEFFCLAAHLRDSILTFRESPITVTSHLIP